jgi:outer membrane protein assembly factor BamB
LCHPLGTGQSGGSIESSPVVYRGTVFVGSDDGMLYAFKAKGCHKAACKPQWTGALDSSVFSSSPAVSKGLVYIAGQHELAAFDVKGCGAKTCDPVWQASDDKEFFNGSPAIGGGYVYIPWATGGANGAVYAGRNTGEVLAWKAGPCKVICHNIWSGRVNEEIVSSSPTVVNGKLYIGSADNQFPENISRRLYVWSLQR